MTTNTPPAGSARRVLHPYDPSEFLAETRICLRQIPTDCLIVMGCGESGQPPVVTTSELSDLLAPGWADRLEQHLELLLSRGCRRASAMIVVGDGDGELPEPAVEELTVRLSARFLATAAHLLPDPFPLESLWLVANAQCRQVIRGEPDGDEERLLVSPPQPLRPFQETRAAADEVLVGRSIPRPPRDEPRLELVGRHLHLTRTALDAAVDPGELFARARDALRRLRAGAEGPAAPRFVTDCEHISELVSAVAVERLHWELLARCVDRGNAAPIDREQLLQILVRDGSWTPDVDVCAGGDWYVAIQQLRDVVAAGCADPALPNHGIAREAWRGLTAMLVLLAWWNHRFATAGGLVDELWEREPASTLAPLLARMTDTPIFPAWWPSP
ncbi:hypothetical protein [Brachybacterium sp. 107]|uniref:hypothetical protein n=1 Tax=Brachybacterium sp. 107 TaxID=3457736 RepID=UPI0040343D04